MSADILVFYMSHSGRVAESSLLASLGEHGIDVLRIQGFIRPVAEQYTLYYELTPAGEEEVDRVLDKITGKA